MELVQIKKTAYIVKILKKRHKSIEKRQDGKHVIIYDLEKFEILQEIAGREGSNISSILNNLYEQFLDNFDSVQKSIQVFTSDKKIPAIDADTTTWKKYLKSLDKKEYKILDAHLNNVLRLHDKRGNEL